MKIRLIKWLIRWLWLRWPYLLSAVLGELDFHVHKNPIRKKYPVAGE